MINRLHPPIDPNVPTLEARVEILEKTNRPNGLIGQSVWFDWFGEIKKGVIVNTETGTKVNALSNLPEDILVITAQIANGDLFRKNYYDFSFEPIDPNKHK